VESVFEIITEPNRRAILGLLVLSQSSVGEIERQLRISEPTVSKQLRVLPEAGFVESRVDAQPACTGYNPNHFIGSMSGWLSSAGSGRLRWMLLNATWTWLKILRDQQHQQKGTLRIRKKQRRPNRERDKGEMK
jgi:DNA-binding transcriptional ArsR family regulator